MEPTQMLLAISQAPIVSQDTLRSDHLCSALIREADRLEIELDRDLWQPAAAIAAHGRKPGQICLSLPPKLEEIGSEIVQELFTELNWHAPSGCSLGESEVDGALFLWELTPEAQAEAINADPASRFEAMTLSVPSHWLSAIVNGDESSFDCYGDAGDYRAYKAFSKGELSGGWSVTSTAEESEFSKSHDATGYGVLACDVTTCIAMRLKPESARPAA